MPLDNAKSGPGTIGEYLVSGVPFLTSSDLASAEVRRVEFDHVTQWIVVRNNELTGSEAVLAVGFTDNGVRRGNRIDLRAREQFRFDVRTRQVFLSASRSGAGSTLNHTIVAGLTTVTASDMPPLSGSDGWAGLG